MMTYTLVISPLARDDLKYIHAYGSSSWGTTRASTYLDALKEQLWNLLSQPRMGIERDELLPGMRSLPLGSHVIFYRLRDQQLEVSRILHQRQDPQRILTAG